MEIKVAVIEKETGQNSQVRRRNSPVRLPPYAVVELSGNEAIVKDLFEKIQETEKYRFE